MRKLKFKEQMAINKATTSKEQMFVARQENDEKVRLYEILMTNEADFKAELINLMYADDPETKAKAEEKYEAQVEKAEAREGRKEETIQQFFEKQGMPSPSDTTRKAFERQKIDININKFLNFAGMFNLNLEAQATASFHNAQLKQNFISIAQQDEVIKQNEKLIEQNETMIALMQQMANK